METGRAAEFAQSLSVWGMLASTCRFIWPDHQKRRLIWAIYKHRGLDRRFYRRRYADLNWYHRLLCAHHYATIGEVTGLSPTSSFSPSRYLEANPDVARAGVSPLLHWLTCGRNECRALEPVGLRHSSAAEYKPICLEKRVSKAKFAICLHIFYPELWGEFRANLSRVSLDFDLFVTISAPGIAGQELAASISESFPASQVFLVENRGRDILPFLEILNQGAFDGYAAVCKIHSKRSPHRQDGDRWRKSLVSGILPRDLHRKMDLFLSRSDAEIWVADGQVLDCQNWWGQNFERCQDLLRRIELGVKVKGCLFPAGSMYWIKPFTLGLLRSLQIGRDDFETENGRLDGTTAHAIERIVGQLVYASGSKLFQTSELTKSIENSTQVRPRYISAFYLPQYHATPENNRWWSEGFTEWTGTTSAQPVFKGHLQPARPLEEYDLTDSEVMRRQGQLTRRFGVDAFCVYFYWFNGKRMLYRPIDMLLARKDIDFPFYFCWANESWRRNWDGLSGEELLTQHYPNGFERRLARDVLPYFSDHRYQSPNGAHPRFVIYRPDQLPDLEKNIAELRNAWEKFGVGAVEIGAVIHDPSRSYAETFDFHVEMPPHGFFGITGDLKRRTPNGLDQRFRGFVYSYQVLAEKSADPERQSTLPPDTIRGIMPSWDNSARRALDAHIALGGNPAAFRAWLRDLCQEPIRQSYRQELFVNAWNEWGERAMLEPDRRFGTLNLVALREAVEA